MSDSTFAKGWYHTGTNRLDAPSIMYFDSWEKCDDFAHGPFKTKKDALRDFNSSISDQIEILQQLSGLVLELGIEVSSVKRRNPHDFPNRNR